MSRFMPPETLRLRAAFCALGVDVGDAPERFAELMQVYQENYPLTLRAFYHRLAVRIREFEHESEYLLVWMLWDIQHMIDVAVPTFIDTSDVEAMLAEAVHRLATASNFDCLPLAEQAELARWVDFVADAYDARVQIHDAWEAKWQARRNSALKGAATRRMRREAATT